MCCPGKRAAAYARQRDYEGGGPAPPFGGPFGRGGRGFRGGRCGRGGGRGGQCRGPPRFIQALFGGGRSDRNVRFSFRLEIFLFPSSLLRSVENPQLTPKYPNKATGREELGEAGYRQQQPDGKHELSSSSSMKYQDYPIERSYKDEKGGKESEEDEEKFEIAEKVQQQENKQHATAARPETLSPPRYSQVFKN